jgi:chemotaxis protein methyltransferase CheR
MRDQNASLHAPGTSSEETSHVKHVFHERILQLPAKPGRIENELIHMIDVVTTNKTEFFREPKHFDYMVQKALPELMAGKGVGIRHKLMVWSAGCSTGEEPYTLAMLLKDIADKYPGFNFNFLILATDISTRVLEIAKRAIYDNEKAAPHPIYSNQ